MSDGAAADLAAQIEALADGDRRRLVAIAGPPGSGKSTLAEAVVARLLGRGVAAVQMPMDGFHLDNRLLEPRGLLPRKGAPETFDFAGFAATLGRIRTEPSVIVPVFDRSREIAIAGAAEIRAETRIVVVEGNYLCLDEAPWRDLAPLWDLSIFLDVPMPELERRLLARWRGHGFGPQAARDKALGNDLPNAERVKRSLGPVDRVIRS
ncbi:MULTISPECIES: nucleoside triphosphate hydrolase [unclassified Roseitalea]|uniref:nucleoside triphosphate hydrolase n=1 Tax=unclassified Roseitalea TaxID=2639107 RepID=UPI00273DF1B8|nr:MULTISPECIES: nucleoside triphosphate hydrolase [unclassified Roseitalea]